MSDDVKKSSGSERPFKVVDLNYFSLYIEDFQKAIAIYEQVFGPPETADEEGEIYGWQMGSTWLTVFPSKTGTHAGSNPRNAEFAIQVSNPGEVDVLHQLLIAAGAKSCWQPEDTEMYEDMRFSCVDDPFGVRIDVYCPLEKSGEGE
jgi:uncharacterized glyoxalase superfamily protein PhnB